MNTEISCYRCNGTGKYLGNGMINTDCDKCDDNGSLIDNKHTKIPELEKIDRRSQSYRDAIKDIMDLNPTISRLEAVKMFDETYNKV